LIWWRDENEKRLQWIVNWNCKSFYFLTRNERFIFRYLENPRFWEDLSRDPFEMTWMRVIFSLTEGAFQCLCIYVSLRVLRNTKMHRCMIIVCLVVQCIVVRIMKIPSFGSRFTEIFWFNDWSFYVHDWMKKFWREKKEIAENE